MPTKKTKIRKKRSNTTVKKVNHNDKELDFVKKLYYENEDRYNDTYKNRKPTNDEWEYERIMIEILLQLYLIYVNYRKMAELRLNNIRQSIKDTVYDYLDNNKIFYKIKKKSADDVEYLYLFKQKYENELINDIHGLGIVHELGEFYTCKSYFDEWKKYDWRIVIACNNVEIFAQKCLKDKVAENMKTTMKIYDEIYSLFCDLDKKKFKKTIPNPLQIHIYKSQPLLDL